MKKKYLSLPAIGGSSLLAVFAVLCLVVFAALSLSTAQAQKRASDAYVCVAEAYYAADLAAEEIFARLRAGEEVPGVVEKDGIYQYNCPVSEQQTLEIQLESKEGSWTVHRWQVCTVPIQVSETITVWDGARSKEVKP